MNFGTKPLAVATEMDEVSVINKSLSERKMIITDGCHRPCKYNSNSILIVRSENVSVFIHTLGSRRGALACSKS